MGYPSFYLPNVGGGIIIAAVAVVHVVIAQFAVGAGIFNAVTETVALRRGDALLLRFLRDNSRFLILFAFIAGSVTGVGIWLTISVVAPRGTSLLIHNFVWAWAIEWVFFLLEIVSGYIYHYTWGRLEPRRHLAVGWIYAASAWISLVVINAIISFMLTPGRWSQTYGFWDGLLNPSSLPATALRTISSLALAGIFCCVVVSFGDRYSRLEQQRIVRQAAYFLAPLVLMVPAAAWYFASVPSSARALLSGGAPVMSLMLAVTAVVSVLIAGYAYFAMLRARGPIGMATSLLLTALAFIATGGAEFVREGIRKPYLIRGYLYSNGLVDPRSRPPLPGQPGYIAPQILASQGVLPSDRWTVPPELDLAAASARTKGRYVFLSQCRQCHTIRADNGIQPLVASWDAQTIRWSLDRLARLKPAMPPFAGSEQEKDFLTEYLLSLRSGSAGRFNAQEVSP